MGTMRHNAIVVTSWKAEAIDAAAAEARRIGLTVLGPSPAALNGYRTLLICPDGSNEGWEESNCGDELRKRFREWTRTLRYEDGSSPLEWCEVTYGNDDYDAAVCASEWTEQKPEDE